MMEKLRMIYSISDIKKIVNPVAKNYGVEKMWVFGSYARGEATSESDIDFRVDGGDIKGYFTLGGLYCDLEEAFGKKIDLLTTGSLEDDFLEYIAKDEVIIYER
jgi:predicted nucleotidyltransferase